MPTPREGETKEEFIERCIPVLVEEGKEQDQAVAQCYSLWEQDKKEIEVKRGLYLAEPHGHLTYDGKKKAIAKAEALPLEGKHILVSKDKALGIMDLSTAQPVTVEEFDERFDEHRVTTKERRKWWDGKDELYLYEIKEFAEFDPPREVEVPDNVKFVIRDVQFKDETGEEEEVKQSVEMMLDDIKRAFWSSDVVQDLDDLKSFTPWVAATYQDHLISEWKDGWYQVDFEKVEDGYKFAEFENWKPAEKKEEWVLKLKSIKAATKRESDGEHPSSHYLVVEDPEKVSTWHLRVKNISGDPDHRLMGAAWAALHGGYRGNVYEGPGKSSAIAKLKKLYDQEDMELPGEKAGRRIRGDKVSVLKDLQNKFTEFMDTIKDLVGFAEYDDQKPKEWFEKMDYGVKTLQLKDGRTGLITWTTNAFKDRENEIFTTKALEDLVERYAEKEVKGDYKFWHIPGSKFGDILWQGVSGRFLVEIGVFDETPVGEAFKSVFVEHPDGHPEVAPEGWGTSHGFKYRSEDRDDGVYEWFDKEETSVLPMSAAANPWNPKLEVLKMDEKQKTALAKLVPDDVIEVIESTGETETKRLEEEKVEFKSTDEKEVEEAVVEEVVEEPKSEETEGEKEEVKEYLTLDDVKPAFEGFAEALKGVTARLEAMDASLKALAEADDEKIEKIVELTPKESLKAIADSAIGKKETLVDGRTALAKDGPEETEPNSEIMGGIPLVNNIKARNLEKSIGLSHMKRE